MSDLPDHDQIAQDIAQVGNVVSPIVKDLDPVIGKGVEIAFKVLAGVEPGIYRAIAAVIQGGALTPEQEQSIKDLETKLRDDPDSYFA